MAIVLQNSNKYVEAQKIFSKMKMKMNRMKWHSAQWKCECRFLTFFP